MKNTMHIAISGASGFVGRSLAARLAASGHRILRLGRRESGEGNLKWLPREGPPALETEPPLDAIVHLAGEPVSQRWSAAVKERIRESRVAGTRHMVEGIAKLPVMPRVLVCASAIGIYGDRGDEVLDEGAPPAAGFLADVCREWEAAADTAENLGVRVVKIRIGLVLGPDGGALGAMLPAFRLGLGATMGNGAQWMSWIHRDDLAAMFHFALENRAARGVWNGVAPNPVTNAEFTRQLAAAHHRPALFRAPEFLLKLGAGEMAQILLNSQRCTPAAPLAAGFPFAYPDLGPALQAVLS